MVRSIWGSVARRSVFQLVLIICMGGILGLIGPQPVSAGQVKCPVLIGGALSLTGIQAPLDEPGLRGAQLAVEELNRKGGILGCEVKFINLDGKSDPVTVGNVAAQLIGQGAVAIVAPVTLTLVDQPVGKLKEQGW